MNNRLAALTDQFLKERTHMKNVTPATLVWYQIAFKSNGASFEAAAPLPSKRTLQDFVVAQRQRGIRPVTVNTDIGAMNAFCAEERVSGCRPSKSIALRSKHSRTPSPSLSGSACTTTRKTRSGSGFT